MKRRSHSEVATKQQARFSIGLAVAYLLCSLCSIGFIKLAWEVRERETLAFDEAVLTTINRFSTPFFDIFMPIATDIGGVIGVTALTVLFVALFIYKNEYRRALMVVVSVVGAVALNIVLKSIIARSRPDLWEQLIHETGYSFPSGHAMASAALGLGLAVALWNSRWRWWSFGFATAYILFVGFSRMYLGVHYPTDILAGWCVSGFWVLAVALMMRSRLGHQALRGVK